MTYLAHADVRRQVEVARARACKIDPSLSAKLARRRKSGAHVGWLAMMTEKLRRVVVLCLEEQIYWCCVWMS